VLDPASAIKFYLLMASLGARALNDFIDATPCFWIVAFAS
jgi:hypothetical protein